MALSSCRPCSTPIPWRRSQWFSPSRSRPWPTSLRIRNLLIVAFARNGTVIPHGEFLIEPDFHRLGVFIGVTLLKRIVTGENMDGCFQALFCARPCHGLAGHLS